MKKVYTLITLLVSSILIISACNLSRSTQRTSEQDVSALYTQAVNTVIAQLTLDAASAVATQNAVQVAPTKPVITMETQPVLPAATATSPATPEPSATPSPTQQPSPTATATPLLPTPTRSQDDITLILGGPTWRDNFENEDNWSFSNYFKDDKRISMEVKDGKVVLKAFKPDNFYGWLLTWPEPKDFYLEITATTGAECSGKDKYGLIFRAPDVNEGYLLAFSCDGRYKLWYWDGDKENKLVDWTENGLINRGPNQTNRLGIEAVGSTLTLYANGQYLASVSDERRSEGKFGLVIGSSNTENFAVFVDKLEYWEFK